MAEGSSGGRRDQAPGPAEKNEQEASGSRGAPQGERPTERSQPPQTSGRRSAKHEHQSRDRGFEAGSAPSEQGDGEPSPERLKKRSSVQGIDARPPRSDNG